MGQINRAPETCVKCLKCDRPARTLGLCGACYNRSRSNSTWEFTPEIWNKWRAAREADEHTLVLREGINKFRALIEAQRGFRDFMEKSG